MSWYEVVDYVVDSYVDVDVKAVEGVSIEGATEWVCGVVLSARVVANGWLIGPFKLTAFVGEDGVRLGAICDEYALERVGLCCELQQY